MLWFWLFMELDMYKRYIYEDLFSLEPSKAEKDNC